MQSEETTLIAKILLFTAIVAVFTIVIVIPAPVTQGYINVGEIGVYMAALIGGPLVGGIAGGVGSMIIDLIVAPIYAPATLVIKGVEGSVAGYLFRTLRKKMNNISLAAVFSCAIGGVFMVTGYFLYELFLFNLASAISEVPGNTLQVVVGVIVSVPVYLGLLRMGYNVEN